MVGFFLPAGVVPPDDDSQIDSNIFSLDQSVGSEGSRRSVGSAIKHAVAASLTGTTDSRSAESGRERNAAAAARLRKNESKSSRQSDGSGAAKKKDSEDAETSSFKSCRSNGSKRSGKSGATETETDRAVLDSMLDVAGKHNACSSREVF